MDTFYSEDGKVLGRAWSYMQCKNLALHEPHSHNPEFGMFGPYMCGGLPKVDLYITKDRKPVNRYTATALGHPGGHFG